jgi:cytochrome c-type biogenesis protein CcmF
MIPEIGHFALVLALAVALLQMSLPMIGAMNRDYRWMAIAQPAAILQFGLIAVAFACLTYSYVVSDFSVANVAENSHSLKPLLYKFSGVWGNHEGSMLLWILILSLFGSAVAIFGGNLPPTLAARVLSVHAAIGVAFLLFILFTSNPFLRLDPAPLDGNDLNPLLQDPGLAFHPPFLYLGYVGFSMAFSFAIAALIEGRVDPAWARWVRPWTLAAWCALTVGIAMGSWWAYYELGWGGWWYWDPVENASFMPWLVGTALLHSAIIVEKRDTMKQWTVLLAIVAFSLSLLGTFLVRSGVLTSVHAFATDPTRGVFILAILIIAIGGSLTLYAFRAPVLKPGGVFAPISREGALVVNNLLLLTATATVLLGTLYPLVIDVLGGGKVSVGAPFFNATFIPIVLPLLLLMAVGPLLAWKRADLAGVFVRLRLAFVLLAAAALLTIAIEGGPTFAALGLAIAAWSGGGALVEFSERIRLFRIPFPDSLRRARQLPRAAYGMFIAHFGVALLIAGVTGASIWKVELIQSMRVGDSIEVAGYKLRLEDVRPVPGPNYSADRAEFTLWRGDRLITRLSPERRIYQVRNMPTTETAIYTTLYADLYAVIGDPDDAGGWTIRVYYEPLVMWIWIGALTMAFGGLVSLTDRRYRVGAPVRARSIAAAARSAAE